MKPSKKLHILVVDDDPAIVAVLATLLKSEGHSTDTASNGHMALEKAKRENYDLVISDISLPGITGLEFFEAAKEIKPDIPTILITAYPDFEYAVKALHLGAVAFIVKPFDNAVILKWVEQIRRLRAEQMGRELAMLHLKLKTHNMEFDTATLLDEEVFFSITNYLARLFFPEKEVENIKRIKAVMSIHESLLNALEHGNLELPSAMKQGFLMTDGEDPYQKLKSERMADPAYAGRKVSIHFQREKDKVELKIRDAGKGFNCGKYLHALNNKDPNLDVAGRGMLIIKAGVDAISYNDRGNEITLSRSLN